MPMLENKPPQKLETLISYIKKNSAHNLSMDRLEQVSKLSQRSIQLLFKSQLQITPTQYLRQVRLDKVRAILQTKPHINISEIALQEGFTHLGRFAQYYKQAFGELPQEMRRSKL